MDFKNITEKELVNLLENKRLYVVNKKYTNMSPYAIYYVKSTNLFKTVYEGNVSRDGYTFFDFKEKFFKSGFWEITIS